MGREIVGSDGSQRSSRGHSDGEGEGGNMFTQPKHIAGLLTFSYEALEGLAGGESFSRQEWHTVKHSLSDVSRLSLLEHI